MNLKNKIMRIIENKIFVIICIIFILIIVYIVVEKSISKLDIKTEEWEEEAIPYTVIDKEKSQQEENSEMKDEIVDGIEEVEIQENENNNTELSKTELEKEKTEKIYVYITGEVNNPGVVILPYGSRISDAIDSAGGITSNADIMKVNLVYMLQDGMKVNIPSSKELNNNPNFEYITMGSGDEKSDGNNKEKSSLTSDNKSNINESAFKVSNVNINTATQTELETLPGIGPSLALKIINYRKENGKFKSIEELKNVSGIGDNKYDEIKQYIYI